MDKLSHNQNASTDIDCKGIVDYLLSDYLDGIKSIHIVKGPWDSLIDQNNLCPFTS